MDSNLLYVPLVALMVLSGHLVEGYAEGAPTSRCGSRRPGHGSRGNGNYNFQLSTTSIQQGQSVTVTLSGGGWQGIMMQATSSTGAVQGRWINVPSGLKSIRCSADADTVTQTNDNNKGGTPFTWVAPSSVSGQQQYVIRATVLAGFSSYTEITSSPITVTGSASSNPNPAPAPAPTPAPAPPNDQNSSEEDPNDKSDENDSNENRTNNNKAYNAGGGSAPLISSFTMLWGSLMFVLVLH